jgi:hypothetical protein
MAPGPGVALWLVIAPELGMPTGWSFGGIPASLAS